MEQMSREYLLLNLVDISNRILFVTGNLRLSIMPCSPKLEFITTLATTLNWVQLAANTSECAHCLSQTLVTVTLLEQCHQEICSNRWLGLFLFWPFVHLSVCYIFSINKGMCSWSKKIELLWNLLSPGYVFEHLFAEVENLLENNFSAIIAVFLFIEHNHTWALVK